jgi:hemin uptake protein HemP
MRTVIIDTPGVRKSMSNSQFAVECKTTASGSSPISHAPREVTSQQLLGQGRELLIVHQGRQYRLRVTQNGKLILTA